MYRNWWEKIKKIFFSEKIFFLAFLLMLVTGIPYFFKVNTVTNDSYIITEDNQPELNLRMLQTKYERDVDTRKLIINTSYSLKNNLYVNVDKLWTLFFANKNLLPYERFYWNLNYYDFVWRYDVNRAMNSYFTTSVDMSLPNNARSYALDKAIRHIFIDYTNLHKNITRAEAIPTYNAYLSQYKTDNEKLLALAKFSYDTYPSTDSAANYLYLQFLEYDKLPKNSEAKQKLGTEIASTTAMYTETVKKILSYDQYLMSKTNIGMYTLYEMILAKEKRYNLYNPYGKDEIKNSELVSYSEYLHRKNLLSLIEENNYYLGIAYYYSVATDTAWVANFLSAFQQGQATSTSHSIFYESLTNTEKISPDTIYFRTFKPDFLLTK